MADITSTPIPVTILTGFLGAGKTTLLNHILRAEHGLRVAVLVNDFGEINIDSQLVVDVSEDNTINLSNGCICCTIRDDLIVSLINLLARPERPEYIIVETSGVSDPVSVALTFMMPELRPLVQVDGVLTVVDAEQVRQLTGENASLAMDQISVADMVVLNKVDLLTTSDLDAVKNWIREEFPTARILECSFGKIPLNLALGIGKFDPQKSLVREGRDVHVHAQHEHEHAHEHEHEEEHEHDHSLVFSSWSFTSDEPFDLKSVREVLRALPVDIFRAKGLLYLADFPARRGILQMVGRRVRLASGADWGARQPFNELVVIGSPGSVDAAELRQRFESALAKNVLAQSGQQSTPAQFEWMRS